MSTPQFKSLNVAVIGGGIGGLAASLSLRRAGHKVTIYERRSFATEVGASITCAANGTKWLYEWGCDMSVGDPVVQQKLLMRDWKTGEILANYQMENYKETWGYETNMFHRQDLHKMLLTAATSTEGEGEPVEVKVDYVCERVNTGEGTATFANGETIKADMIIGADGIRSRVRTGLGIIPDMVSAPQTCFRCNVRTEDVHKLGLVDYSLDPAIQIWGGFEVPDINKYFKIVMCSVSGGATTSFYCFMPTEYALQHVSEGFQFKEVPVEEIIVGAYKDCLHEDAKELLKNSIERMPWRLYLHKPYPRWVKGKIGLLGDAAHPMMPHQSQGACQAIEDAAVLGLVFSKDHPEFTNNVKDGLAMYERIRKPRATRIQTASRKATDDLHERIGFTTIFNAPGHKEGEPDADGWVKLTMKEVNTWDPRKILVELTSTA
ncbi:salicylate [Moniliophthora roreri MCA 2997]|uniref:Salicylate n=2 Tax=Moniliophthora roreri TaxID=221103 RepID=V2XQR2_MONRO|nr:salicylate [Moniliophthora roreri MCA 2997]KAI3616185.1 salicylate [Moniliophthora roreri]